MAILKPKTVDDSVAALVGVVNDLYTIRDEQYALVRAADEMIAHQMDIKEDATLEADRAERIADAIAKLVA